MLLGDWPWYVSGPLITLTMLSLVYMGKTFGMSSNLKTVCSIFGAGKFSDFFNYDWKSQKWNLIVVLGAMIGGYTATHWLTNHSSIALNPNTIKDLKNLGFDQAGKTLVPPEIYDLKNAFTWKGLTVLIGAGFLVGFGTRYAGGCTSGHAITGLSNLQLPSLIAVIGFFTGGLVMTYFILPLLF